MIKQITVVAIKVDKYRNGVKIGETRRDLQLIIDDCPNNDAPFLSGINNGSSFNTEVCAESQICFSIHSFDNDAADSLSMSWNNAIPGATFTVTPVPRPVGTFCWTPTESHASSIPYYFTVKVQDDACPVNASTIRAYRILVKPLPTGIRTVTDKECGLFNFDVATSPPSSTTSWSLNGPGGLFVNKPQKNFDYQFKAGGSHPHELRVTSAGCVRTYRDTLDVPNFTTVDLGRDSVVCEGSTFNINPTILWGQAVEYTWSTGDTTLSLNNITLYNDSIFALKIKDVIGCYNTDSVKFTVNKYPRVDLGGDRRICSDDTLVLTPTITYLDAGDPVKNYAWYNLANNSLIGTQSSISLTDSGTYSIVVSDSLGCSHRDTMNLFVNPEINIQPPAPTICNGDTVKLSAYWSSTSTYKWTVDGNPTVIGTDSVITVWPSITTTYRVSVQETVGSVLCENSKTVTVTVNDTPNVTIGSLLDQCINNPVVQLNMGSPPGGVWTGKGVTYIFPNYRFSPSNAGAGTHPLSYTYTDNNGCTGRATKSITVHDLPVVDAGTDFSMCTNDAPLHLGTRGATPTNGLWQRVGNSAPQTFISGTLPNQYLNPGVAPEGFHNIMYTATHPITGCVNRDTVKVTINQSPVVTTGTYGPVCEGSEPITLNGTPAGAGGKWIVNTDTLAGNLYNPVKAGNYNLEYCFKTASGCLECASTTLVVNPIPVLTISAAKTSVCEDEALVDLIANPVGGIWTGPGVQSGRFNPATADHGINTLTYTYTDFNGCEETGNVVINVQEKPEVAITGGQVLCTPFPNELEAAYARAGGIQWSTRGDGDFSNPTATKTTYTPLGKDLLDEEYWIIVQTTGNGHCGIEYDSTLVKMHPSPQPGFVVDFREGCQPHDVRFTDTSSIVSGSIAQYTWDFGDGNTATSKNPVHTYENSGMYTVKLDLVSDQGCKNSLTKPNYIEVFKMPEAAFTPKPGYTTIVLPTIGFENQTTNANNPTWLWNFDDHTRPGGGTSTERSPTYMYDDTGKYEVLLTVTTQDGCVDTAYRLVIIDPDITVFVPNAFAPVTPGPEQNNVFKPVVNGVISYKLQVYNRWGELLFETVDREEGWDGKYRGQHVSEGVYVYVIKAKSFDNNDYRYTGTITLLK